MSSGAQVEPQTLAKCPPELTIRTARLEDTRAIVLAICELLAELGGDPPVQEAMETAARALIDDPQSGALLLAEVQSSLVGTLAASQQTAIHVPGEYLLIQDLWVAPAWRSRQVGSALIGALLRLADERGITRLEVGLPRAGFAGIEATESFYRREGFTELGTRMRRVLG